MCKQRDSLIKKIVATGEPKISLQRCPYTAVHFTYRYYDEEDDVRLTFEATGFAKCRWPDPFDAEYGLKLAKHKAAAAIAKEIMAYEDRLARTGV